MTIASDLNVDIVVSTGMFATRLQNIAHR